jgi:hypothetical protein
MKLKSGRGPIKKVSKEVVINSIDFDTGRVAQQTTTQTFYADKEPDYVKLYITDIMKLSNLPKSCNSLLMELLNRATYNNEIVIVKYVRLDICKRLNMAEITFRKAMEQFIEKGILTKKDKQIYIANPFLFARGSWENIRNIRLLVEYNAEGRFLIKEDINTQGEIPFTEPTAKPRISGFRFDDKIENKGTNIVYLS